MLIACNVEVLRMITDLTIALINADPTKYSQIDEIKSIMATLDQMFTESNSTGGK